MGIPSRSEMVSGLPFYVWEVPDKPISIQLPFDVIDRMSPEILRGFGALKRRGAEVGGLLLGRSELGERHTVVIEDFEPVQSEYLTGPSYNLSENDLVHFEAAMERRSAGAERGGPAVIGFYRSHTRGDLYMDDVDLSLAVRYFSGAENVFLLIKPFASRPSVGGFFFWEGDGIYRESTYLQFPFHRKELGGGDLPRLAPPQRAGGGGGDPEQSPLPPYTPVSDQQSVRFTPAGETREAGFREVEPWPNPSVPFLDIAEPQPSGWRSARWLAVPALLVAGVGGYFAYRGLNGPKPVPLPVINTETALPLKLSVAERQNQLDVNWDRNAPAVLRANRGVLSITDGGNRRDLELSGAQLRNGRVLYSRLSGDVNLRMEVFPEGQNSVSESIRIVLTDTGKPEAPRPVTPAPKKSTPAKTVILKRRPPAPVSKRSAPPPSTVVQPRATPPAPAPEVELQRPSSRR